MSKKKLDISSITNELRGQSVFFPKDREEQGDHVQQSTTPPLAEQNKPGGKTLDTVVSQYHDTTVSSNHDTTVSQGDGGMIEAVRRAVKQVGKEPATQRLT